MLSAGLVVVPVVDGGALVGGIAVSCLAEGVKPLFLASCSADSFD